MKALRLRFFLSSVSLAFVAHCSLVSAEPVPLKRIVELALSHSASGQAADAAAQRAFATYRSLHDQYIPSLTVGSGVGPTWGYPLTLEGSAPSIVNTTAQSSIINPALREFLREARTEVDAASAQSKDQHDQIIQDAVLSYVELSRWETLQARLGEEYSTALKAERIVNERIQAGVDNPLMRNQARLHTARVYLHISQAQGAIDVLRKRLEDMTGLPSASIETVADSIPPLPEVKQEDNLPARALETSPSLQMASLHSTALTFHARGEHRALWPTVDFAAQYALLATFNNYQHFFQPHSFQANNAALGVVVRFPFFNASQHARAQAADADALRARKDADTAKNQVSEQTLRLQRSVQQLTAAQEVADLEYQIAKSDLDALEIRVDAGTATLHEEEDARMQMNERYDSLQDAEFQLERARITLLRATGDLGAWVGVVK
jgi:outer membrane protein TolC